MQPISYTRYRSRDFLGSRISRSADADRLRGY